MGDINWVVVVPGAIAEPFLTREDAEAFLAIQSTGWLCRVVAVKGVAGSWLCQVVAVKGVAGRQDGEVPGDG